jgi:uncharacterized protein YpuA (DUF1002 family)
LFQLEDRLIFSYKDLNLNGLKEIDWEKVNDTLKEERDNSEKFLERYLK